MFLNKSALINFLSTAFCKTAKLIHHVQGIGVTFAISPANLNIQSLIQAVNLDILNHIGSKDHKKKIIKKNKIKYHIPHKNFQSVLINNLQ